LSAKHGAAIAEVGGMRDLEMQILPHVWTNILPGRVKCQQDRGFMFVSDPEIETLNYLLTYLLTHSLTYSLTHSLTYLLTHLLTHSLTHLLTHSLHGADSFLRN
jgi:hypothetical protein